MDNKYTSIQQLEGGYVVTTGNRVQVVTSSNKAIKIVREYLHGGEGEDAVTE